MNIYQLRVSIIGIPNLYRIVEATGNCTFDDLHETIFEAFNRYDPHLYSFFITKEDTKNMRKIWDALEITNPQNVENFFGEEKRKLSTSKTVLDDADLKEKDVFYYLFDFGDDWWHRIRVNSVKITPQKVRKIKIIKSVGEFPEQYPNMMKTILMKNINRYGIER